MTGRPLAISGSRKIDRLDRLTTTTSRWPTPVLPVGALLRNASDGASVASVDLLGGLEKHQPKGHVTLFGYRSFQPPNRKDRTTIGPSDDRP
jgi:hypothetical protein